VSRILIVPASYKTTLSSLEVVQVLFELLQSELPEHLVEARVITDGGEGTVDAFEYNFNGVVKAYEVTGPLGQPVQAKVCWLDSRSAVLESSQVVGYSLVPPSRRDPWQASSFGVGELIRRLVVDGAREIFVTMGDSAIMDMGVGMLDALGVEFYAGRRKIERPRLGDLNDVTYFSTESSAQLAHVSMTGLVDTKDYLCGSRGQAETYGHQKGMRESERSAVENALYRFTRVIAEQRKVDVARLPMATGSGGLAAALHAFQGAPLIHTPEYFSRRVGLDDSLQSADYVITGEGCLDDQTRWGKVPYFVASRCSGTCVAIVGSYTEEGRRDLSEASANRIALFTLDAGSAISHPRKALAAIGRVVANYISQEAGRQCSRSR